MVLPPGRRQAALIRAAFRCSSHIPIQPKWATPLGVAHFGASDVTRTRDLLITSGVFWVFYRFVTFKKLLQL